MMSDSLITILTDFGLYDPFVGIMKGVIARLNPAARTIDLSHDIPPGDILRAGIQLWQAVPFFPAGTIFLVVVDPGVGTQRRGLIVRSGNQIFIGPDNGVFSFVMGAALEAWELREVKFQLQNPSTTFHGRDIFAPAAAHSTLGHLPEEFGPMIPEPIRLPAPRLLISEQTRIDGEILYADRFGNLLTSLGQFSRRATDENQVRFSPWLPVAGNPVVEADLGQATLSLPSGEAIRMAGTFTDIPPGKCAGVIGSSGLIEIAANNSSAAEILKLSRGMPVSLTWTHPLR